MCVPGAGPRHGFEKEVEDFPAPALDQGDARRLAVRGSAPPLAKTNPENPNATWRWQEVHARSCTRLPAATARNARLAPQSAHPATKSEARRSTGAHPIALMEATTELESCTSRGRSSICVRKQRRAHSRVKTVYACCIVYDIVCQARPNPKP